MEKSIPNIQPILSQRKAHGLTRERQIVQVAHGRQVLGEVGFGEPDAGREAPEPPVE